MKPHRISLTAEDIALIVAALRARRAASTGMREHRIDRLIERLDEGSRGNPKWIHTEPSQTHEEELEFEGTGDGR